MSVIKSYNPTTNELLAEIPVTPKEQIDKMVASSHVAQKKWAATSIEKRASLVSKAYKNMLANKDEIAQLIHDEMGKTLSEAEREVAYYCGNMDSLSSEIIEALKPIENNDGATNTMLYRDPLGVCASITPWNFPLGMPHTLMMPSLIAGNTILFKPSEEVTLIGQKYASYLNEVLPKDVFQVVVGTGEQGKYLVESNVQLITFTGSQATGKNILANAGRELKRVLLELGGKDPLIVLDDANIEEAAKFAANNSFRNAGQVCVSTEKILVHKKVAEEFVQHLRAFTKDLQVGHMIHEKQKSHVVSQVKDALEKGAEVIYGEFDTQSPTKFNPMILNNVRPEMNIMIDETFGPVACVTPVNSEDEAIKLANHGDYALGGVVFSNDLNRAENIARQLKAGMVGINRGPGGAKGSPWVGAGQSGYGYHGSTEGHRQFTQLRIVSRPV